MAIGSAIPANYGGRKMAAKKQVTAAQDDRMDRKAGIKEGSKRDNALDRKRGVPVKALKVTKQPAKRGY